MKKVLLIMISLVIVFMVGFGGLIVVLAVTDYNPDSVLELATENNRTQVLKQDGHYSVYTWNIGYCSLGAMEDFFYDGGTKSKADSKEVVEDYMSNIITTIKEFGADFIMIQEIDVDSARSYKVNQLKAINESLKSYSSSYASNYDVEFVPVPFPPMGKVEAGQSTYSRFFVEEAFRYSLPGQYNWPKSLVMLDRCMIVSRLPIEGVETELVLINAHFSAYDDGSIRTKQMEFTKEYILKEYEKGNYVVLGGDWNQTFPSVDTSKYPMLDGGAYYTPYMIPAEWLEKGWSFAVSDNAPTYRLLNEPYKEGITQTGVIDGFLLSPNIADVETEVIDLGFENSDHNPVKLVFELK